VGAAPPYPVVIPAQAGTQSGYASTSADGSWAPACAGVTVKGV